MLDGVGDEGGGVVVLAESLVSQGWRVGSQRAWEGGVATRGVASVVKE